MTKEKIRQLLEKLIANDRKFASFMSDLPRQHIAEILSHRIVEAFQIDIASHSRQFTFMEQESWKTRPEIRDVILRNMRTSLAVFLATESPHSLTTKEYYSSDPFDRGQVTLQIPIIGKLPGIFEVENGRT